MFKIGLSTCGKVIDENLFRQYGENGITAMEISPDHGTHDAVDFPFLETMSRQYGVDLWSYHFPFGYHDISNPSVADEAVSYYCTLMERASRAGITVFIVHPSAEPIAEQDRAARMAQSKESLKQLVAFAKPRGLILAVEDLPRTCLGRDSAEMLELLSVDDSLRVCLDTNHLLKENLVDFIHRTGDKIVTLHVSDYDFVDERHWLPGEGGVDWQAVYAALKEVGYQGPWLYELRFNCPATICRDRDLDCADFARNAAEIFENRPLTKLSH